MSSDENNTISSETTRRFRDDIARVIAEIEAGLHMADVPPAREREGRD